ncbi:MAG TPA: DUF2799 domain-containing protein [Steroidobacteraceae bacterium]|nr:DUF2799 domain-containing protein [Steroidobacteraceae bacterium]
MAQLNWPLIVIATATLTSGCAGMDRKECELADWRAVGYEDGARGLPSTQFGAYRRECSDHGVAPDFEAYQAGRAAGVTEYCQPSRGFQEGARGATYAGVCPPELEDGFVINYDRGRTLYLLESEVQSVVNGIHQRRSRINAIERELVAVSARIIADETTGDQRAQLIVTTKQLTEERVRLSREVEDLEVLRKQREQELAEQRAELVGRL